MKPIRARTLLTATCAILCLAAGGAAAQQPYYKGKRISVLINFAAGGPPPLTLAFNEIARRTR